MAAFVKSLAITSAVVGTVLYFFLSPMFSFHKKG